MYLVGGYDGITMLMIKISKATAKSDGVITMIIQLFIKSPVNGWQNFPGKMYRGAFQKWRCASIKGGKCKVDNIMTGM